jgi:sensor c-di-GMP phosphodiesterase-like protein
MANQIQPNNSNASDDIDLGQLVQLIKNGINQLGNFLLRIFIYLKNSFWKLLGLATLGLAISFGLNQIISKKLKTDVIVRPNFESKNYLYDVVNEISSHLEAKNEDFFGQINITVADLEGFKISVVPIDDEEIKSEEHVLNDMKYLELLNNFKDENFVVDILRSEISAKSGVDHKITFTYKNKDKGSGIVKAIMNYINTNEYFENLRKVSESNAKSRIEKNKKLIEQIDQLVDNFSVALLAEKQKSGTGVVYMEKENTLNVPALLSRKANLLKEIEEKKLEIAKQTNVLSILNFGKTQQVEKSFFNETYFLIPSALIIGFLLLSFFQYLSIKAKEIE